MDTFDAVVISIGAFMTFAQEATRFTHKVLTVEIIHNMLKAGVTPSVDISVAVSEPIFRSMQPRRNDVLIHNGVDTVQFSPGRREKRERVVIVQIAAEGKAMNPDLYEIAELLIAEGVPIEAHFIGKDGPSSGHIIYHGLQSYETIPSFLQKADILFHMSDSEPFGMTAIEAMAVGTLPIVSDVGGLPFSAVHNETGYVAPLGDKEKVVTTIKDLVFKILHDHPDIAVMRDNAIKRVDMHYNLQKTTESLGMLIEEGVKGLQRENRSSSYPFSFVAPTDFFIRYSGDCYLEAMEEILLADNHEEALAHWKEFLSYFFYKFKNYQRLLAFLDRVYSQIVLDWTGTGADGKSYCYFWLALLALSLQKYDKMLSYLVNVLGDNHTKLSPPHTIRLATALLYYLGHFFEADVSESMMELSGHIKQCYLSHDLGNLAHIGSGDDFFRHIVRTSDFPGLLSFIEQNSQVTVRRSTGLV